MYKYIHIPFCKKKCYYCDFTTFEGSHDFDKYFTYLAKESGMYPYSKLHTLYFGGGTPSLVPARYINKIIEQERFHDDVEITLEVNPEIPQTQLGEYEVNRVSIGIQTFDDDILRIIGRLHTSKKAIETYEEARKYYDNVSVDLMFGLPGQTMDILKRDLEILKTLDPEHISIYSLIWKEYTPFFSMKEKGLLKAISEDEEADQYEYIIEFFESIGYKQYEVSSFCKKDKVSKHNIAYWTNQNYIGLGLGASGYINDVRYTNYKKFDQYYQFLDKNMPPIGFEEQVSFEQKKEYEIILGLRLLEGIPISGKLDHHKKILDKFIGYDMVEIKNFRYVLTKKGMFLSNEIFQEILS